MTLPRILALRLTGLRVAVDVQHLFRPSKPKDQGAVFTFPDGTHRTEGSIALAYAQELVSWLGARGATVFTNDPVAPDPVMVGEWSGPYSSRNAEANKLQVHAYLACHVNAGRGCYGAVEALNGSPGVALAAAIVRRLVTWPELRLSRVVRLNPSDRGGVCIRGVESGRAAVLLEPLFGDCTAHQAIILRHGGLADLAGALGEGLAAWYESR